MKKEVYGGLNVFVDKNVQSPEFLCRDERNNEAVLIKEEEKRRRQSARGAEKKKIKKRIFSCQSRVVIRIKGK